MSNFKIFTLSEFSNWLNQSSFNRQILLLQNHHTWSPAYAQFKGNNHMALLQGMYQYHTVVCGWQDIAQNLTTFPDGSIATCRDIDTIPAGIKGANQYGICIEHLGNFDINGDTMTPEHAACITGLNALLCSKFHLTPNENSIVYHHWYDLITGQRTNGGGSTKTCPGTNFFGGNTVENAKQSFYPLVIGNMKKGGDVSPSILPLFHGTVNATSLHVRKGPGPGFDVVRNLLSGAAVTVYEENNSWYRIHATAAEWVSGQYILKAQQT